MIMTRRKAAAFRTGACVALFFSACQCALPIVILPNALPTISLSGASESNNTDNTSSIAYNPVFQQYYGAHIGNPSFNGFVWNSAGTLLQTRPLGTDARAFNYNPNTNSVEIVTYAAQYSGGLYSTGLDGSGLLTGTNSFVLGPLPGLNSDQTMPAYDPVRNRLYSRNAGGQINVVDRGNGSLISTINLDLASAGNPSLQQQTLGYDSLRDVFITIDTTNAGQLRAIVHSISGSYLGASNLPPALPFSAQYCMGYANGQLFLSQANKTFTYRGFQIFAVPEPATGLLLLVGASILLAPNRSFSRRRR